MVKLFNTQFKGGLAKKASLLGLIVLLILAAFCYGRLLTRPFPFLNIDYVSQYEWDHDEFQIEEYENFPISTKLAKWIEDEKLKSTEQKIIIAANFTRNLSRASSGTKIRMQNQILDISPELISICSETSKIFTTLMNLLGVPSRVVFLNGHTVSEIFDRKWILIDSFGNVRGYDSAGTSQSVREIVANYGGGDF